MTRTRFWIALLVIAGLSPEGFAHGERWLQGQVLENHGGAKRPAPGAQVWIVNVGNPYTTLPDGGYRVLVPDAIRDGQKIVLYVKRKGWAIDTPPGGELSLPTDLRANIILSPDASREFLSTSQIDKFLERLPENLRSQIKPDATSGAADPAQVVKEYAAEHRLAYQEVLSKVEERVEEFERSGDQRNQCLSAVYRKHFDQAAMLCREGATAKTELLKRKRQEVETLSRSLHRSEGPAEKRSLNRLVGSIRRSAARGQFLANSEAILERRDAAGFTWDLLMADASSPKSGPAQLQEARRQLIQLTEDVTEDLRASGDAHYANYHFDKALAAYKEGLGYADKQDLPTLWATMQWVIGMANNEIGIRTKGKAIHDHLAEAMKAYREAQTVFTKTEFPAAWAALQNNLGTALRDQGTRTGGAEGTRLLAEAVTAYRAALTVYTKAELPQQWADTSSNLAEALFLTGQFVDAREQLTKMFRYSDLDSGSRVPLLAIEVANNVALGMPKNVQSSFDTLQQVLGKQASDFTLTWRFSAIKLFIGKNQPFARHRSWILAFFESLESKQRDDMQTAVNSARSEFLKTAEP